MAPKGFTFSVLPRDLALLSELFHSRLLTLAHCAKLHFNGSKESAKKRIQKLKASGLIGERPRKSVEPSVLFLTPKGFKLLQEQGKLEGYPKLSSASFVKRAQVSPLTLKHELEVMDVKAGLFKAISNVSTLKLEEFSTWPLLYEFEAYCPALHRDMLVKPDGFIRVHEQTKEGSFEHTFFLEVDRSTETLPTLVKRATCYVEFYKSGGMAERHGMPRSAFKDFPFRVLFLLKTQERRNNLAEALLDTFPPIRTQVWLGITEDFLADPLGKVFIRPADYCDTLKGSPFDGHTPSYGYRRMKAREVFVERNILKRRVLEN